MENTENKSTILSEEQINNIEEGKKINEDLGEEIVLDSDKVEEETIPEKYAGKSAEEVYRLMKIENEYKASKEETPAPTEEETPTEIPADIIKEYTEKLIENGGEFTEEDYIKLAEQGYNKDFVDNYKAGVEQKQLEEVRKTLEEASTTPEEFQKAVEWAKQNWDEARVEEYNKAMIEATNYGNKSIQNVLIRSLTDSFNNVIQKQEAQTFHSNSAAAPKVVNGYEGRTEYFKDVNDVRYRKDPSYRKLVEEKYLKTDRTKW